MILSSTFFRILIYGEWFQLLRAWLYPVPPSARPHWIMEQVRGPCRPNTYYALITNVRKNAVVKWIEHTRVGRYIKLSCNYTYKCFNCGRTELCVFPAGQATLVLCWYRKCVVLVWSTALVQRAPCYGNVREVKGSARVKSRIHARWKLYTGY